MTCENCKVMELLDDFNRRMQRNESPDEALDDALTSMRLREKEKSDEAFMGNRSKEPSTFTITCAESGCHSLIHYSSEDNTVPIYCTKHRTKTGRHAQVRKLK